MVGPNDRIARKMERDQSRRDDCIPTAKAAREAARRAKPEPDACKMSIAAIHEIAEPEKMINTMCTAYEQISRIAPGSTIRDRPWRRMHDFTVSGVMNGIKHHTAPIAKRIEKVRDAGITAGEAEFVTVCIHVIKTYTRPSWPWPPESKTEATYSQFEEARNAAIYFVNQVIDRTIGMR